MKTKTLHEVLSWMRGTDIVELSWRSVREGLELRLEGATAAPAAAFPATSLIPVPAHGVGLFRWSAPGQPRSAVEGAIVAAGERLGLIDTGGATLEVCSPTAGRLAKILVDEGKAVEWGQPLFLVTP